MGHRYLLILLDCSRAIGGLVAATLLSIGCTSYKDPNSVSSAFGVGNGFGGHGTGYNGEAPRDLVQRCAPAVLSNPNQYQISCGLFKEDGHGTELPVTSLAPGVTVTWQKVKVISGLAPLSGDCAVSAQGLSQSCQFIVAGTDPVTLQFDALITSENSAEKVTLTDRVMLPYFVQSLGVNSKAGRIYSKSSGSAIPALSAVDLNPNDVRFVRPQFCAVKNGMLVADNDVIYYLDTSSETSAPKMRVFAGGVSTQMALDSGNAWDDRLRLPFFTPIAFDCKPGPGGADDFSVYVLSFTLGGGGLSKLVLSTITPTKTSVQFVPSSFAWSPPRLTGLRVGTDGKWYFIAGTGHAIYVIDPIQSSVSLFAGSEAEGETVEGSTRLSAKFRNLRAFVFSPKGDLYAADTLQQKIFRIDNKATVHAVVGGGVPGAKFSSSNPLQIYLPFPMSLGVNEEDIYLGDATSSHFLILHTKSGTLTEIKGITSPGTELDSRFTYAMAVAADRKVWLAYPEEQGAFFTRIGRATLSDLTPRTLKSFEWMAGATKARSRANFSNTGIDDAAPKPNFAFLIDAAEDPTDHSVVFADSYSNFIFRMNLGESGSPRFTPVAGRLFEAVPSGGSASPDGTLAVESTINSPLGVTVSANGSVYFTESATRTVKKVDVATGRIKTVANLANLPSSAALPDSGQINLFGIAILSEQTAVSENGASSVLSLPTLAVADQKAQQVVKLTPTDASGNYSASPMMNLSTLAGVLPASVKGGPFLPRVLKTDAQGSLWVGTNFGLYRMDPDGTVYRIGGGGTSLDPAYEGAATGAVLNPIGLQLMADGSLYVSDNALARVVRLEPVGTNVKEPRYHLTLIASSNSSIKSCGSGTIAGQGDGNGVVASLNATLSQFCVGVPLALAAVDRCHSPQRDHTLLVAERLDVNAQTSIILRATRACQ